MDLTDAQWAVLEPLFRPKRRADGRGRPWQDTRAVLSGVFWVLRTGAPWHDLPSRYPSYQTCHRRFQQWQRSGLLTGLLQKLAEDLRDRGKLDLSESFIDASFSGGEKRGSSVGPTKRGKGSKIMAIADGHGFPLSVYVASASPHETKLIEPTLDQRFLADLPERMIGDRAYDSDPLDQRISNDMACNSSRLTSSCASQWRPRRDVFCAATGVVGKWNVCSPGFITFAVS
jgi:transposase